MKTDRTSRGLKLLAIVGAFMVVRALAGCAANQSVHQKKIDAVAIGVRAAHEATNKARDGFVVLQRTAEAVIVAAAPDEAAGLKALAELDRARSPVLKAFALAYAALARAEALIALVQEGRRDPMALIQAAMEVARTTEAVYAAVAGAQ